MTVGCASRKVVWQVIARAIRRIPRARQGSHCPYRENEGESILPSFLSLLGIPRFLVGISMSSEMSAPFNSPFCPLA
jgi:hypothetical protein